MSTEIAAVYVRLSREDEIEGQSQSIENQIKGIKEYCITNKIAIYNVYCDDGASGKDMNRVGFQKMIDDMYLNKFNTIIVKDLSRLGRNLVLVGQYVEEIFPDNNIRLISISDNYDSLTYNDDESVTLRMFLNDYYLKECKKKVQAACDKRAKSINVTTYGIYGYKVVDKQIVIDEEAANIVKMIYADYLSGMRKYQIRDKLNNMKVLTPGAHKNKLLGYKKFNISDDKMYTWNNFHLDAILSEIEYTGVAVNNPRIRGSKKNPNPIIIENTHPVIISKEDFEKVQSKLRKITFSQNLDDKRLTGMCICECGKHMYYDTGFKTPVYRCQYCNNRIQTQVVHQVLYKDAVNVLQVYEENPSKFQKNAFKKFDETLASIEYNQLKKQKEAIDLAIEHLFEDKLEGIITQQIYNDRINKLKRNNKQIEEMLFKYEQLPLDRKLQEKKFEEFKKSLCNIDKANTLELIRIMIESVIIYKDNKIKIKYKFQL